MFRIIASALIALVAISSGLAHAHGETSGDDGLLDQYVTHQAHMSAMIEHGDNAPTRHDEHSSTCVLGHCATACGVILPFFETVGSVTLTAARNEYIEQTFVGLISTSDPPPPKS